MVRRRRAKRAHGSRKQISVVAEAHYITRCAQERDTRVVSFGQLVFFSTETGDAWVLDPEDVLARCLARDGDPLPTGIFETQDQFGIEWISSYRIEEGALVVTESTGRTRALFGYPVMEILHATALLRRK